MANISFWFVSPHGSLCTVRSDKIPGKQSRSRSFCIVFPQQWRLEWCMGVEADKCGISNRVKALLLYPFGGRMPSTEAIKWSLIKNDYSPIRTHAIWSAHTVPHCSVQIGYPQRVKLGLGCILILIFISLTFNCRNMQPGISLQKRRFLWLSSNRNISICAWTQSTPYLKIKENILF